MLSQKHKDARTEWELKHQNDDRTQIIFTDKACYY